LSSKKSHPAEYTMFSILEYLCLNSLKTPVTKNHIIRMVPNIRQQRSDRISNIMDVLEQNGFVKSIKTTSETVFYQVTDKGIEAYYKWVKDYLDFIRSANELIDDNTEDV
jgi:DNA-binding PadR family transcriptional regulator